MKLYFLSENNMDNKVLIPRVPKNFLTINGYEDNTTPRVCFSESISGALAALSQNLNNKELYVHTTIDDNVKFSRPSIKDVPDVMITKERWVKQPVKIKCIGKIIAKDNGKPGEKYKYGDNKIAILYTWDYEWINRLDESYVINEKDIYYNKDKFDSGEINLCFITGHSGSGKSTMGRELHDKQNVEHYDLDDLNQNYKFTDDDLKEYGDLIYSFFKAPGKKYRYYSYDDMQNCTNPLDDSGDEYDKCVNVDFIKYAMKYAKSHKDTKFVIEGIWIYFFMKPEELKDYAVYIKGTSMLISSYRASKRDSSDENDKFKRFLYSLKGTAKSITDKYRIQGEKLIKNYRNYFSKLNESKSAKE